ncbi:NTP transferase domain-containing protein [Ammoniphilus sp. YIM 78166]|uniref:nucleotidyltransferase family protein n=1 Tax=Ammoniphilus sp. YIM 78166 TaxID=1644106 RepID=UPI00106F45FD|nr:nucleotidyltransferase family protein [Ammoniphilus sp. YIM 78166]
MGNIGALILAAGMATRMGQPKQLIPLDEKPLFRYSVDAAVSAGLKPIILVGGKHVKELRQHVTDIEDIEVIENEKFQTGMASSLKVGIKALTGQADAVVVFLADQPFVHPVVVQKILEIYEFDQKEGVRIIRPVYAGVAGHPVLFDADLFGEFENIQGDEGGKSIIKKHQSHLKAIPFESFEWGMDADTPEDLAKIKEIAPRYAKMMNSLPDMGER